MVDIHSRLMPSQLFALLQDAALSHCRVLDLGRDKTNDRGYLWVVTQQTVHVSKLPFDGETVTLATWPGVTRHMFMPRYTEVYAEDGSCIAKASACWILMEAESRKAVNAASADIYLEPVTTGRETPFLNKLIVLPTTEAFEFTTPYSYCDLNGHLNNCRYFDLACDHTPEAAQGRLPVLLQAEYRSEVRLLEQLHVEYGTDEGSYYFTGSVQDRDCFRLCIKYE